MDLDIQRDTYPTEGTITILLDRTLFDRWQAHGDQGSQGIDFDAATTVVTVTGQISATLAGLPLAAGEERQVTVSFDTTQEGVYGVQFQEEIDGQPVGGIGYQWIELDVVPPEVVSTSPPDGAIDVALDQPLVITFTEPIGPLSFDLSLVPAPGSFDWQAAWNQAGTVVTVTHDALSLDQTYWAHIAAGDAFANPLAPYSWPFTTIQGWRVYLPVVTRMQQAQH